jgi:hypothetical protein
VEELSVQSCQAEGSDGWEVRYTMELSGMTEHRPDLSNAGFVQPSGSGPQPWARITDWTPTRDGTAGTLSWRAFFPAQNANNDRPVMTVHVVDYVALLTTADGRSARVEAPQERVQSSARC